MARTLTVPGPLDTLEEAFDLLQHASASVWLGYFCGVAPLIVGLLWIWNEHVDPLMASLLAVALLVWFYRRRQVFAGQLRAILSLKAAETPLRSWWCACFEGTKLLAIPLALMCTVPLAYATAFYRSLTLFAAEGLSAREALAKAWKSCVAWQRENWIILGVLILLGVAVLADIAIAVIIAPILAKMFTGYENVSIERLSDAAIPIIFVLTWLCFDPLVQAVYTVRAFRWEGERSGGDLLVRLKRLAPVLFVVCFMGVHLSAEPQVQQLDHAIDQTLQSHDYDWRTPALEKHEEQADWFVDTVDRALAFLRKGWKAIRHGISEFLDWIGRWLRGTRPVLVNAKPEPPSGVRPVFYAIGAVVAALALVLLWKFRGRKTGEPVPAAVPPTVDLRNESLLASDLPEDEWLAMAERYAGSGDLRLALRALYLGTLALLNSRGLVTLHACKSNRDYERELRRRSRDSGLGQIFHLNIRSFEQSWYGFHEVTGEQLTAFRDNLGRMRTHAA